MLWGIHWWGKHPFNLIGEFWGFYYPGTVGQHCSYTYMCPKGFRLNPGCDIGFCNYTKWIQLHMTMKPSYRSTFKNVYECVNDSWPTYLCPSQPINANYWDECSTDNKDSI